MNQFDSIHSLVKKALMNLSASGRHSGKPYSLKAGGQAMVEFLVVVMFCFVFMVGIYEVGILFHNYTVMNSAMRDAAWAASLGAPDSVIMQLVLDETENLFVTGFLNYAVDEKVGLAVEVWNGDQNIAPKPSIWTDTGGVNGSWPHPWMIPNGNAVGTSQNRAEYIFRAEGYNIRVGMVLKIGIYIPVIQLVSVISQPVTASMRIQARNDLDHDGMVDIYEPEWFWGRKSENAAWVPYSHRDGANAAYGGPVLGPDGTHYADDDYDTDVDGDGIPNYNEQNPKTRYQFDFNGDGLFDQFDTFNRIRNPLIGPLGDGA